MFQWQVSFRVDETQDFETRFNEVKSGVYIPAECTNDVAEAHDVALFFIQDRNFQKPYAVYLIGTRDSETVPATTVSVSVQNSP